MALNAYPPGLKQAVGMCKTCTCTYRCRLAVEKFRPWEKEIAPVGHLPSVLKNVPQSISSAFLQFKVFKQTKKTFLFLSIKRDQRDMERRRRKKKSLKKNLFFVLLTVCLCVLAFLQEQKKKVPEEISKMCSQICHKSQNSFNENEMRFKVVLCCWS